MGTNELTAKQTLGVNVVSIVISGLIVRSVYVLFDWVRIMVEESSDENVRDSYRRTIYYLCNAILVIGLCLFLIILIYEYYINRYVLSV